MTERSLGDERRSAGDWAMAARHYRAHLARNSRDFGIWVQLGHAYKEAGRLDDADAAYQSAHALEPDDADLLLCRGHLAKLRGDLAGAVEFYGRSFAVDANPAAARELGQISRPRDEISRPGIIGLAGSIDGFRDGMIAGWAINHRQPDVAAEVEVLVDGTVIATGVGDIDLPDVVASGLARRASGFLIDLSGLLDLSQPTELHVRVAGTLAPLAGSPVIAEVSEANRLWSRRWNRMSAKTTHPFVSRVRLEAPTATLSVIVPITGDESLSQDLIESLERQWCDRWEALLIPLDGQALKLPKPLQKRIARDGRFRILQAESFSLAGALSRAAHEASGDHVLVLPFDSVLEPEAVWRILDATSRGADLVYWDEARIGRSMEGVERFVFRSALSIDHFTAFPALIGSFALGRRAALAVLDDKTGDGRRSLNDFRVACVSRCRVAAHVPAVLERRRGRFPEERQRPPPLLASRLNRPGQALGDRTLVVLSPVLEAAKLRPTVQAILSSADRAGIDLLIVSRARRSAAIAAYLDRLAGVARVWTCEDDISPGQALNDAVGAHARDYSDLVLIDAPVLPSSTWLAPLLSLVSRPEVAIAAPILVAADGKVVSAGVGVTVDKLVHSQRGIQLFTSRGRSLGWNRSLVCLREQSAAYGCVVLRTETFVEAGGLDPIMSGDTAFTDLCLRLARTGRRTVIDPRVVIKVAKVEPAVGLDPTFRARWAEQFADGDPFLSPSLDDDLGLATLETTFFPARIRAIDPPLLSLSASRLSMLSRVSQSEPGGS